MLVEWSDVEDVSIAQNWRKQKCTEDGPGVAWIQTILSYNSYNEQSLDHVQRWTEEKVDDAETLERTAHLRAISQSILIAVTYPVRGRAVPFQLEASQSFDSLQPGRQTAG